MLVSLELECERRPSDIIPTGEGPSYFFDILFGVVLTAGHYVIDAHREQLLELTAEILVWFSEHIRDPVKPDQHRCVLGYFQKEIIEPRKRVAPQQHVLVVHENVLHLGARCREVVMPEERHLLFELALCGYHPRKPPSAKLAIVELVVVLRVREVEALGEQVLHRGVVNLIEVYQKVD